MGLFKRGYETAREEKERQDRNRENSGRKLFNFFLSKDGDEADLRFLTEEPINFYEHNIRGRHNGKDTFTAYTCTGDNCPFCAEGDRPTYRGAYLVIDKRPYEYTDKNGKKRQGNHQLRLFKQGMRVISQLDRISEKYGLSNRDVTMVRLGSGTQTTYTIERGEKEELAPEEIVEMLPDNFREDYDGTMESFYNLVEEQLMMNTKNYVPETNSSDEEDDDESVSSGSGVIGVDSTPAKPKLKGKGGMFKKNPQNSLKPRKIRSNVSPKAIYQKQKREAMKNNM